MYQTLKLSLLAGASCLVAASATRAEEPSAAYVDDTSVVGFGMTPPRPPLAGQPNIPILSNSLISTGMEWSTSCLPMVATTKPPASPSSVGYSLIRGRKNV